MAAVGQGMNRVDGIAKVTGKARYAAEVPASRLAHAVMVSAKIALGRVKSIDRTEAEKVPGVLLVMTPDNAPRLPPAEASKGGTDRVLQLLSDAEVRYFHQPVAVVVAETLEQAQTGAALLVIDYETRTAAVDMTTELGRVTTPKAAGGSGAPADSKRGDLAKGMAAGEVRIHATYTTPPENHNPMEMHATLAVWQGDDHLTLYDATQGVFEVRRKVSSVLGLPKENVRVLSPYVGGGFGCKGSVWSHVLLTAMVARQLKRPVKLMISRSQMFGPVGFRPRTIQEVTLSSTKAGKLSAIQFAGTSQTSRIDQFVEPTALSARMLYSCENVTTTHRIVDLDTGTPTFMRAPGEASGTFGLESAMDELSYALAIDPIELRLRNYADKDEGEDKPFSSKSLRECYKRAGDQFGWSKRKASPGSMRDGRLLVGWGMATATYPANLRPASAVARLFPDGTARVEAGSQDIGTGTYTVMTQLAADLLGLPTARVRFDLGDTEMPETPTSGGSATAASVGTAVHDACQALRAKLAGMAAADHASPLFGAPADDIVVDDGVMSRKSDAKKRESYADLLARAGKSPVEARADAKPSEERKKFSTHSFGAQLCEVKIDPDTRQLQVTRFVGAFACGKILNEKTARSQFMGGIVWGIGMALHEHTIFDPRNGRIVNHDLSEYVVPVNADVPLIEVISVAEDDPHVNPIGVKGIGEIGITGAAAAIANAVYHATGKRVRDLPITVDKLL